ncbi:MAG TPA: hypothetical protein DCR10_03145, partial [Acidimicrobiaceae bacterium]|nr:hypothetical protein [Acidimicrobiaceae bacterium]
MDSTQMNRGSLEGKDRDELTTIATALGGKPGSRARKAEIVDLILELAGGAPSNGSEPTNGSSQPVAEDDTGGEAEAASAEEPPAEWELAAEAE